jgi:GDP-fucose transporter C1
VNLIAGVPQGCFGFLIGVAGLLSVKVTSPVTHMTSSAARGVLQTMLGFWFFEEILTSFVSRFPSSCERCINTRGHFPSRSRIASICIIIVGSCYYIYIKHLEQEAKNASKGEYQRLEQLEAQQEDAK